MSFPGKTRINSEQDNSEKLEKNKALKPIMFKEQNFFPKDFSS